MDYFKLFTVIGIAFSIGLGLCNVWISLSNRRNAIREHLFKEQIDFLKKFSAQLVLVVYLFEDIEFNEQMTDGIEKKLDIEINRLDRLFDEHVLILPTLGMFDLLAKVLDNAQQLHSVLIEKSGEVDERVFERFYDTYYIAIEKVRDYYQVEELSKETLSLSQRRTSRNSSRKHPPKNNKPLS
jgi:hypothetical protein